MTGGGFVLLCLFSFPSFGITGVPWGRAELFVVVSCLCELLASHAASAQPWVLGSGCVPTRPQGHHPL